MESNPPTSVAGGAAAGVPAVTSKPAAPGPKRPAALLAIRGMALLFGGHCLLFGWLGGLPPLAFLKWHVPAAVLLWLLLDMKFHHELSFRQGVLTLLLFLGEAGVGSILSLRLKSADILRLPVIRQSVGFYAAMRSHPSPAHLRRLRGEPAGAVAATRERLAIALAGCVGDLATRQALVQIQGQAVAVRATGRPEPAAQQVLESVADSARLTAEYLLELEQLRLADFLAPARIQAERDSDRSLAVVDGARAALRRLRNQRGESLAARRRELAALRVPERSPYHRFLASDAAFERWYQLDGEALDLAEKLFLQLDGNRGAWEVGAAGGIVPHDLAWWARLAPQLQRLGELTAQQKRLKRAVVLRLQEVVADIQQATPP
ncbi:MAG: hypothetical protein WC789_05630 [Lentisphaeria bacterium]|jgi:hypothetical protein